MTNAFFLSNKLNYTFVNEDHVVEYKLLENGTAHAVAVAGSGTRLVPLLARAPRKLTLIDISQEQVWLTQFRYASLRSLSREKYMALWGYVGVPPATPDDRERLFAEVKGGQSEATAFVRSVLEENGWGPLLPLGGWEKTFQGMAKKIAMVLGEETVVEMFSYTDNEKYQEYLRKKFPWMRWKLLTAFFANSSFFNSVLYKSQFPRLNIGKGYMGYYNAALRDTVMCVPARENFFLQILILGKVAYPEALPMDTRADLFEVAREVDTEVVVRRGSLLTDAASAENPASFIAVSDVPSYFKGEMARNWLQDLRARVTMNGMLVARYYRHRPENSDYSGWKKFTSEYSTVCREEKTFMYHHEILRKVE